MKKKPRRRRAKRSTAGPPTQHSQRLSREARELLSGEIDGEDWAARWEQEPTAETSAKKRARGEGRRAKERAKIEQHASDQGQPAVECTVVACSSGACTVEDADGKVHHCTLPSEIARDQRSNLAVGDLATFVRVGNGHRLDRVLPRKTFLARPDPLHGHRQRVIAANMDLVVQVSSVGKPPLKPALIDRYLIAIEQGGAVPLLVLNKIDLVDESGRREALEQLSSYAGLGHEPLACSVKTGEGIDTLLRRLSGKLAVFVGHSGVGKSSLVNALDAEIGAETGLVRDSDGRGRHTTTRSNLYRLGQGIRLIDTPGIREFGLWSLDAESLRSYFPDFLDHTAGCKFRNCSHTHEPRCGVRDAVDTGDLPEPRYATYLRIFESLDKD